MSVQKLTCIAPLPTTLPDHPQDETLTPDQWATLLAIAETVIPTLLRGAQAGGTGASKFKLPESEYDALIQGIKDSVVGPPDEAALTDYLAESAVDYDDFRRELQRTLTVNVRKNDLQVMTFILNTLNTRLGSLVFNGSIKPITEQGVEDRTAAIQGWSEAYLTPLRQAHQVLTQLIKLTWIRTSPTAGRALGFPRNPVHRKVGKGYDYEFIQVPAGSEPYELETDVVIVGSGCGAGVAAKNLAESGHRVVVVDKGRYYPPEYLPMTELHASQLIFEGGGYQPSNDNSITVTAGSTWGGGGTVNWSASIQTQAYVRREWADRGLDFFASAAYQDCLDRVCGRMGVSVEHVEHNFGNHALLEGARRLGYAAQTVPQNTGGTKHACGYCTLGCGAAEKQGPVVSWLPDAARAGARFVEGYKVSRVLFDDKSTNTNAVGVTGTWKSRDGQTSREVIVRAKKVVISAGTLWSPLILLESGLKNRQIGRNLKLHPVSLIFAIWPKEIRPWEGSILTAVCDEFQNLDGHGHGTKLECMVMLPAWILPLLPGLGLDFKKRALKMKQMTGYISLARDKDSGRVYPDRSGLPKIAYSPSATDRAHCMEGVIALAKICYVMGAEEIYATNGTRPYVRPQQKRQAVDSSATDADVGVNDPGFREWLAKVKAVGLPTPGSNIGSAHQMGSCRMGVSEADSVVGPTGRVWGAENLYVADASVFPSASGVNPMVTNMAISDWISRGIAKELDGGKPSR